MKKEEIYLDLSKCSQEEIENVFAVLPKKEYWNQYDANELQKYLHFDLSVKTWWVFDESDIEAKTEINYSQFMELMGVKPLTEEFINKTGVKIVNNQPTELEKEMFEFLEKVIRESMMSVLADEEAEVILEKYKNKYGG